MADSEGERDAKERAVVGFEGGGECEAEVEGLESVFVVVVGGVDGGEDGSADVADGEGVVALEGLDMGLVHTVGSMAV